LWILKTPPYCGCSGAVVVTDDTGAVVDVTGAVVDVTGAVVDVTGAVVLTEVCDAVVAGPSDLPQAASNNAANTARARIIARLRRNNIFKYLPSKMGFHSIMCPIIYDIYHLPPACYNLTE
jgi:hypothetical protein